MLIILFKYGLQKYYLVSYSPFYATVDSKGLQFRLLKVVN